MYMHEFWVFRCSWRVSMCENACVYGNFCFSLKCVIITVVAFRAQYKRTHLASIETKRTTFSTNFLIFTK